MGATEQQIADAFAEARDSEAILIFDEADSLLADRRSAHRSWEVSQVNEMLTWMESYPLPFACTKNFGEHLDPATLQQFVVKMWLGYLAPEQVEEAFRAYFALPPPGGLTNLAALTPGDFAVVHRKAWFQRVMLKRAELAQCHQLLSYVEQRCLGAMVGPRKISAEAPPARPSAVARKRRLTVGGRKLMRMMIS